MNPQSLKFTVVIPTRERADVLGPALRTVVAQDYDNLQILVSDNFSQDATADVVRSFDDKRIRYLNTGQRFSMSHNWEFALSSIDDGWVTILGDDDGLCPGALARVAEIAAEYGTRFVRSNVGSYRWPSLAGDRFGLLKLDTRKGCVLRDTQDWLTRLRQGSTTYLSLPALYTGGFVDHALIEQARDQTGSFYRSMVPDVYSSVVFSRLVDRFVYSHESLALAGVSRHSTGEAQFAGKQAERKQASGQEVVDTREAEGQTDAAAKYYAEPNMPFHEELMVAEGENPPPSMQLLVYESLLQSSHLPESETTKTNHAAQLEIILRDAKPRHRPLVFDWARSFAARHDLDFEGIRARASKRTLRQKFAKRLEKISKKLTTTTVAGSAGLPLANVHEATIVAAAMKRLREASGIRRLLGRS